jgi:hypothetical protein
VAVFWWIWVFSGSVQEFGFKEELMDMTNELRWMQVRWQFALLLRFKLGLNIKREMFLTLLAEYKELAEPMIALAMAEGDWLRGMVTERGGLVNCLIVAQIESRLASPKVQRLTAKGSKPIRNAPFHP